MHPEHVGRPRQRSLPFSGIERTWPSSGDGLQQSRPGEPPNYAERIEPRLRAKQEAEEREAAETKAPIEEARRRLDAA
jgi:hypothetical protein